MLRADNLPQTHRLLNSLILRCQASSVGKPRKLRADNTKPEEFRHHICNDGNMGFFEIGLETTCSSSQQLDKEGESEEMASTLLLSVLLTSKQQDNDFQSSLCRTECQPSTQCAAPTKGFCPGWGEVGEICPIEYLDL